MVYRFSHRGSPRGAKVTVIWRGAVRTRQAPFVDLQGLRRGGMALNLEDKKALVAEVAEVAAKAPSVVAAAYRGLTVSQSTERRAKAGNSDVYMRVDKTTLARKARACTSF